ncbi:hypothetical protein BDY19DRAFT_163038 [Irpex rosettiformis]|uniref:Uncharacterized protein n=1 Tax=Irpex rosettiformis TaxID=378272 RepID=A0ACB8U478_9APHY|nr:hypothetical protein BDY19DRAFT_163038 [Irpex rosettiformis]
MPTFNFVQSFMGPNFVFIWLSFMYAHSLIMECLPLTRHSLYGIFISQVYFYYTTYHDHWSVRLLVFVLCILESFLVATCMHMTYIYLVIDWGDLAKALEITWSIGTSIYLEIVISGLVQSYYIFRIWRLSQNIPVVAYLVTVYCIRLVIGFRATAYACMYPTWSSLATVSPYRRLATVSFAVNVLVDSSITLILTFYLRRSQTLSHKRSTKNIIHKLISYAVGAGTLTMMMSIAILALFDASKNTLHFGGLLLTVARVYANSMLAMLNIRQGIKRDAALDDRYSLQLSNLPGNQVSVRPAAHTTKIQVIPDTSISTNDDWTNQDALRNGEGSDSILYISQGKNKMSCV